ncbi:MAG: retron system putative HNH endonuclease [Leptospiraceae bacterium]|nr:retron system putative HNH endonuclease [Leptospiraceae bacterium]
MIKIHKDLNKIPKSLQDKKTNEALDKMIQNKKYNNKSDKYYRAEDVKEELAKIYFSKCAYCETRIEATEIDHFRPKSIYYWLAFSWDNLLISCRTCNSKKWDQFKIKNQREVYDPNDRANIHSLGLKYNLSEDQFLINPEQVDPEALIEYELNGSIQSNDEKMNSTIKELKLNRGFLIQNRKSLIDEIEKKFQGHKNLTLEIIQEYIDDLLKSINDKDNPYLGLRKYYIKNYLIKFLKNL